ncbi:MAG TPA: OB-fold domain-containing protein [Alphaproteobacteria bacterium]|nr:OB-fold domain-containing protein [Alphaproteobacteria bacterium]
MSTPTIPITPLTQPYWEAAARGVLAIQRCRSCRRWIHFPEPSCPNCGSADLDFEPVSGKGKVETFSVIHKSFVESFADRVPYVIAWIALEEQPGLRAFGNVAGCAPDEVAIGMPVEVFFETRDGAAMPNFRKADQGRG